MTADSEKTKLVCTDKFGREVKVESTQEPYRPIKSLEQIQSPIHPSTHSPFPYISTWSYTEFRAYLTALVEDTNTDDGRKQAIQTLTALINRRYPTGDLRRSSLVSMCDDALNDVFAIIAQSPSEMYEYAAVDRPLPKPARPDQTVIIDAREFEPDGERSVAMLLVKLYKHGFCKFVITHTRGHRFIGNGFGFDSVGVRIDVYGSSGDYLASGLDGMEIHVHGNAQDQLCQIMKSGKLVVHGDVGQTFGYAAKGGEVYILGNAAGRPMINAVGKPRVVINGTCLDYLAEFFMAGDPHNGGGFVILNGIRVGDQGEVLELSEPYPGGNLFSLASGGAIYVRDPQRQLSEDQLNGGEFVPIDKRDWEVIEPYLKENQRLFGISLDALLKGKDPTDVYRKIQPHAVRALQAEEAWVHN